MKKVALKLGAVACVGFGISLMAMPSPAVWEACRSDGGYHPPTSWSGCYVDNGPGTPIGGECAGPCGQRRIPKGSYCADAGKDAYTKCEKLTPGPVIDPDGKSVPIERYQGGCESKYIKFPGNTDHAYLDSCYCPEPAPEDWSASPEPVSAGRCKTVDVPRPQ